MKRYEVRSKGSGKDVIDDIAKFIKKEYPTESGIIYCFSRNEAESVAKELKAKGISTGFYHSTSGHKDQVCLVPIRCTKMSSGSSQVEQQ